MEAVGLNASIAALAGKIGMQTDMQYLDNSTDTEKAFIFFAGEAFCLVCAVLYYRYLPPGSTSTITRHAVAMAIGILVGFFSFGSDFFHVIIESTVCFILIQTLPASSGHIVVFVTAMAYLVGLHLYRAFAIPKDVLYSIDVSGPLMLVTMKITSLAFGLYDGCYGNKDKLSDLQKRYMISKPPSSLEYFSYIFYFQGVVVGPHSFYPDYIAFVEGTDLRGKDVRLGKHGNNNNRSQTRPPTPYRSVGCKLLITLFWMGFHFIVKPLYPEIKNTDPVFIQTHGFLYRLWYMVFSMLCARAKYYVAFTLGDAICNASGFGFSGYDVDGRSKWDLITNMHILGIETATSLKSYIDHWNIQTAVWLRHVCYDRMKRLKRLSTFFLSAMWHGCYPGYYFTFLSAAFFTEVSRMLRKKVRPYFQGSWSLRLFYDILTWMGTHIVVSYFVVPFAVLHLWPTLRWFNSMYWSFHILGVLALLISPYIPSATSEKQRKCAEKNADLANGSYHENMASSDGVKED